MSLPLSVSTSYVAGSVPPVHAQDLNDLQTYLAGLYSGQYTIKSLDVDGTGGNAAAAPAGAVRVTSSVATITTTPPFSMPTVPIGQLNREQVLLGAVRCEISGGAVFKCGGFNVASVQRVANGAYTVTFNNAFPTLDNHVPLLSLIPAFGLSQIGMIAGNNIVGGQFQVSARFIDIFASRQTDPLHFFLVVVGG